MKQTIKLNSANAEVYQSPVVETLNVNVEQGFALTSGDISNGNTEEA